MSAPQDGMSTRGEGYTERLVALESTWWRRLIPVQAPYRWNLRRLRPSYTLDIGCGIGRNLAHLRGLGVGVDHNELSVQTARSRGFEAYTPDAFRASARAERGAFDSLLLAHVLEHMSPSEATSLVAQYLDYLKPDGRVICICPQERGYKSDATHVTFLDFDRIRSIAEAAGMRVISEQSFPLPRRFGSLFAYNEFVVVAARRPAAA